MGLANLSWRFYVIFAIFNCVNGLIVFFFFVETAQKTLEEVDLFFLDSGSVDIKPPPFLRLRMTPCHIERTDSNESYISTGRDGEKLAPTSDHMEDIHNLKATA